jgi:hypothetical protein
VGDFDVVGVGGSLEHGLFHVDVDFCAFDGLVAEYSFDVRAVRKKIERLGLEVVDPKAHRTTTSLQIPDDLPSVEEVLKELAGALKAARTANHDKVDVQARITNCYKTTFSQCSRKSLILKIVAKASSEKFFGTDCNRLFLRRALSRL